MEPTVNTGGAVKELPPAVVRCGSGTPSVEEGGGDPGECPLCRGWELGPGLPEAMEEGERMLKDPSLRWGYRSVDELFAGIRASADD